MGMMEGKACRYTRNSHTLVAYKENEVEELTVNLVGDIKDKNLKIPTIRDRIIVDSSCVKELARCVESISQNYTLGKITNITYDMNFGVGILTTERCKRTNYYTFCTYLKDELPTLEMRSHFRRLNIDADMYKLLS